METLNINDLFEIKFALKTRLEYLQNDLELNKRLDLSYNYFIIKIEQTKQALEKIENIIKEEK